MKKCFLHESFFIIRFSYDFFFIRFFRKNFSLHFDLRIELIHNVTLFKWFFYHFFFDIDIKFHKVQVKLIYNFLDFHQNVTKKNFDTIFEFLDILMNSMIMKIRLFKKKLEKTIKLIVVALSNRSFFQKKKLEQLIDFLIFCAKVIVFDRFFFIFFFTKHLIVVFLLLHQ